MQKNGTTAGFLKDEEDEGFIKDFTIPFLDVQGKQYKAIQ